jgi:hypothetical protein
MGGGGGDPSAAARRDEAARQQRIDTTITGVNQLYDSPERQSQITNYGNDLLSYFTRDLDKQKTVADRELKFANARSGTIGGSLQVDQNRQLGQDYQEGVLNVGRKAQAGMADLRAADEQGRITLTSLAQNGLSQTNAVTQAAAAMRSALDTTSAANKAQGIGDLFGNVLTAKNKSEEAGAKRRADKLYAQAYTPFFAGGGG